MTGMSRKDLLSALDARGDMLRQAHSGSGMPLAFSEAEAEMRIAAAGEEAFRRACRGIEAFAGGFEGEAW